MSEQLLRGLIEVLRHDNPIRRGWYLSIVDYGGIMPPQLNSHGNVYIFEVGTTTPKITYRDKQRTIINTHPVVLDSVGFAPIYVDLPCSVSIEDRTGHPIEMFLLLEENE